MGLSGCCLPDPEPKQKIAQKHDTDAGENERHDDLIACDDHREQIGAVKFKRFLFVHILDDGACFFLTLSYGLALLRAVSLRL